MNHRPEHVEDRKDARGAAIAGRYRSGLASCLLGSSLIGWMFLAWMAIDMGHPFVQLMMPASSSWTSLNLIAILSMWAIMMAAMMLPSALPTVMTFARLCKNSRTQPRLAAFIGAYLLVWIAFSGAATLMQWVLQWKEWVDMMIVSTSATLSGALLLIAGIYQFSPLKRVCLAHCRTPIGFLLGEWRIGVQGAFVMGLRHGLFCLGCCWSLMILLFVGGVMDIAWIAALSIAVAIEKMARYGDKLALVLGVVLIAAGAARLGFIFFDR